MVVLSKQSSFAAHFTVNVQMFLSEENIQST